jgi:RNA-directed DNA polymerase
MRTKNKKTDKVFANFKARVNAASLKRVRKVIRELHFRRGTPIELADIAEKLNPTLRGWMNYYGKYTPGAKG